MLHRARLNGFERALQDVWPMAFTLLCFPSLASSPFPGFRSVVGVPSPLPPWRAHLGLDAGTRQLWLGMYVFKPRNQMLDDTWNGTAM